MSRGITGMAVGVLTVLLLITPGYAFKENIVAAWTMDEGSGKTVHDVANGNDGELKGGAEWVDGKFGKALSFDGSSGYVEIPFNESLKVINQGDFTLAAWFMPNSVPTENKEVFQQGDKNGTGRTWLFIAANVGEIRSWLGGDGTYSGVNVKDGEWYHAAVVVTEGETPIPSRYMSTANYRATRCRKPWRTRREAILSAVTRT